MAFSVHQWLDDLFLHTWTPSLAYCLDTISQCGVALVDEVLGEDLDDLDMAWSSGWID